MLGTSYMDLISVNVLGLSLRLGFQLRRQLLHDLLVYLHNMSSCSGKGMNKDV